MEETIQLSLTEPFDIVNYAVAAPYPGTEWGNIAESKGWLADNRWEAFDQNYSAQVNQPDCDVHLVRTYQRKAYLQYYLSKRGLKFLWNSLRPEYIGYFIKSGLAHLN